MKVIQPSFGAGELASSLAARVDLDKYRVGAALLENFFVLPQGGAANRPGTKFVAEALGPARLIPFQFSVVQSYVLEFTEFKMRIIKDGGIIEDPPGTLLEIDSPYAYADLAKVKYTQSADTLFLVHPSYPPYKLTRTSHVDWLFTALTFSINTLPPNGLIGSYDDGDTTPAATRVIEYQVSTVGENSEESLPCPLIAVTVDSPWFAGATVALSWPAVLGAKQYRVYKNSRGYFGWVGTLIAGSAKIGTGTPISNGDNGAHANTLAFDGLVTTYWECSVAANGAVGVGYIGKNFGAPTTVLKVRIRQGLPSGGSHGCTSTKLQTSPDGATWTDVETFTWDKTGDIWQERALTTAVTAIWFRLLQNAEVTGGVPLTRRWAVAELEFYEEGLPTNFLDDNINEDPSDGPQNTTNPFPAPDDYPGAVALFQQRLFLGRTNNNPQTIWATQTGLLSNMGVAFPLKDTDSLQFTIYARQVNEIRHMIPINDLLLFTSGGEWTLNGGGNQEPITPHAINARVQGYCGCADPSPISVGYQVLFVQRNGNVVREMQYNLYFNVYETNDVSLLAEHLFAGHEIVDWARQQDPYYIVWAVRDDGVLLGFTYIKEQQVYAWHRHTTDGEFISVAVVDEGAGQDEVYFCVKRNIGGSDVYYLEKLSHRATDNTMVFSDSSLSYSGAPATVFSGLDHLEGETVKILADGSMLPDAIVTLGKVTLDQPASTVVIGLPVTANLQTMKLEAVPQGATAQGRHGRIPQAAIRLLDSRGGFVGPDAGNLAEFKFRDSENYNAATGLLTGDLYVSLSAKWVQGGCQIYIRQTDPLPITVLGVIPEITTSEE